MKKLIFFTFFGLMSVSPALTAMNTKKYGLDKMDEELEALEKKENEIATTIDLRTFGQGTKDALLYEAVKTKNTNNITTLLLYGANPLRMFSQNGESAYLLAKKRAVKSKQFKQILAMLEERFYNEEENTNYNYEESTDAFDYDDFETALNTIGKKN